MTIDTLYNTPGIFKYWIAEIPTKHIRNQDWFVCVHVRGSGFKNDAGRFEYRNNNIINYTKAFERIIERGGWVIRMGDSTMTKLPKMERVIDYPFTKFKSDLMDIFLIKNCRFYIGTQSGIMDVANLFQKPVLVTNMSIGESLYPMFENSRGIVKHVYSHSKKRILTVKEMFEASEFIETLYGYVDNEIFKWYENSPEEIEEAVVEYMDLLKSQNYNRSRLQNEVHDTRTKTYHKFCNNTQYPGLSYEEKILEKWRFSAKIAGCNGAICQKFLEKHWN
jgi:putative glycosyltransferase (TIGR04372 family)